MTRMPGKILSLAAGVCCLALGGANAYATPLTLEVSIAVRETEAGGGANGPIGADGGTSGGIEWINRDGQALVADGTWQQFTFVPTADALTAFAGITANSVLDGTYGVFEHIRFRSTGDPGPWVIYIDEVVNVTSSGATLITGFEPFAPGAEVMFQEPSFSGSTFGNLEPGSTSAVSNEQARSGAQSYRIAFEFVDDDDARWVRLTTFNTPAIPNPRVVLAENVSPPFAPSISFWLLAQPGDTQVPEPGTLALLGTAAAGFAFARRRAPR